MSHIFFSLSFSCLHRPSENFTNASTDAFASEYRSIIDIDGSIPLPFKCFFQWLFISMMSFEMPRFCASVVAPLRKDRRVLNASSIFVLSTINWGCRCCILFHNAWNKIPLTESFWRSQIGFSSNFDLPATFSSAKDRPSSNLVNLLEASVPCSGEDGKVLSCYRYPTIPSSPANSFPLYSSLAPRKRPNSNDGYTTSRVGLALGPWQISPEGCKRSIRRIGMDT